MNNKVPLKGGLEYDILTKYRRVIYCSKHGLIKFVKRKYNKRLRKSWSITD
jgi:hypothetical protein